MSGDAAGYGEHGRDHKTLAAKGLLPAEHFVDSACVDAALLVGGQRDHGVSLEGPVRGTAKRQTQAEQAYEQRHFSIDWKREQVTCPQGKTSAPPGISAVFSRTYTNRHLLWLKREEGRLGRV